MKLRNDNLGNWSDDKIKSEQGRLREYENNRAIGKDQNEKKLVKDAKDSHSLWTPN